MNRPWMPLYIADYLHDTSHLRALESGAYLHLIMAYWSSGKLPSDDRQLATIAKLTDKEWKACKPCLAGFFGPDFASHKRIDAELAKAAEVSSKRRASAEQRWSKQDANADANAYTLHTSPNHKEERLKSIGGKGSGWSPPKHGAFSKDKGLVYIKKGTPEWVAHASDYATVHFEEPKPDRGGGYWFKMKGEAA